MKISRIVRILLYLVLGGGALGAVALVGAYFYVSATLPRVDTLADYRPSVVTEVFSADDEVIAEFSKERRIVVPVSRMPEKLIQAFVSAEDSNFFQHKGIDLVSIFRAALKNLKAGGIVQGGSTITQQVAKSLLLTPEKKFSRKFKEAILAWRMEHKLSKQEILYLYLNQIYLGHAAYGVQAAAENYFAKNVEDLSLAECAMLAGLPQAPSRYSPYRHFEKAKDRQKYVLTRMVDEGYLTPDLAAEALNEELVIHPRINKNIRDAQYFTEQVRRYLEETYGAERLYSDGLKVQTTMNLKMQQAAQQAVQDNLRDYDKRHGYRGPTKVLKADEEAVFLTQQETDFGEQPPVPGAILQALLTGSDKNSLHLSMGLHQATLPLEETKWAAPLRVVGRDTPPSGNASAKETLLPIGSVLDVKILEVAADGSLRVALEQRPEAQGALVALDPHTGQVRAMVGGFDFGDSQFNRVIQAHRLPGSAIKPVIYAAALDKGYTPATVILDTPVIYKEIKDTGEETEWKPKNYTEKFYGPVPLRDALARSQNVITIKILEDIGIGYAISYARKLGITSPLNRDLTLALGSSALSPLELATAYCVFANGGVRITPNYLVRVMDRNGRVLESIDPADFPGGPAADQRLIENPAQRVISPETAYLISNLMESVVRDGTGWRAKALKRPVAGKTGTTNDLKDAWFAGFVPQLAAVSWVGFDQERPLGKQETGSKAAAPAWVNFMQTAVADLPVQDFPVPDDIEFRPIDPQTGLLAPEDSENMHYEAFAPGTTPTRYALDENKPQAQDFFKLDLQDL